ncbi:hypothetical protein WG66_000242 [Moniliophthora roreri]|nr:hypothetical protein WG66_000242 [Moniliophthora roreri]
MSEEKWLNSSSGTLAEFGCAGGYKIAATKFVKPEPPRTSPFRHVHRALDQKFPVGRDECHRSAPSTG